MGELSETLPTYVRCKQIQKDLRPPHAQTPIYTQVTTPPMMAPKDYVLYVEAVCMTPVYSGFRRHFLPQTVSAVEYLAVQPLERRARWLSREAPAAPSKGL